MAKGGKILISVCEKLITRNRLQSCWGHSRFLCCLALSPLAPQQKRLRCTRQLTRNAWQVNGSISLTAAGLAQLLERWTAELVRFPGPDQYSGLKITKDKDTSFVHPIARPLFGSFI